MDDTKHQSDIKPLDQPLSADPQYLPLLNQDYNFRQEDASFTSFRRLPLELRQGIWRYALAQHRLIEIALYDKTWTRPPNPEVASQYATTNALDKIISGQDYTATVRGTQLYSKLLRTTRESRLVALRFYRVHIPCYIFRNLYDDSRVRTKFYINPERDFIHITLRDRNKHSFVDLVHDLRAYDPQGVGLLNLVIDHQTLQSIVLLKTIENTLARDSLTDMLTNLSNVIWMIKPRPGPPEIWSRNRWRFEFRGNYTMPIRGATRSFDLFERDPRSIKSSELEYVLACHSEPRRLCLHWCDLMDWWNIRQTRPARQRVLFAYDDMRGPRNGEEVKEFLRSEEDRWREIREGRRNSHLQRREWMPPVEDEGKSTSVTRAAVGFWLLPIEALGSLEGNWQKAGAHYDMTKYWPELGLFHLY